MKANLTDKLMLEAQEFVTALNISAVTLDYETKSYAHINSQNYFRYGSCVVANVYDMINDVNYTWNIDDTSLYNLYIIKTIVENPKITKYAYNSKFEENVSQKILKWNPVNLVDLAPIFRRALGTEIKSVSGKEGYVKLQTICEILGLSKIEAGKDLMNILSKPIGEKYIGDDEDVDDYINRMKGRPFAFYQPIQMQKYTEYCVHDCTVLYDILIKIQDSIQDYSELEEIYNSINSTGVAVNLSLAKKIILVNDYIKAAALQKVGLPESDVRSIPKFLYYINSELDIPLCNLKESTLKELHNKELSDRAKALLEAREAVCGASIAKAIYIVNNCKNGRAFNNFILSAAISGRDTSKNLQLQNFPSNKKLVSDSLELLYNNEATQKNLKELTRSLLIPDRNKCFYDVDFSGIEIIVFAFIFGIEEIIQAFRDGVDVHSKVAAMLFNVSVLDVSKKQRQDSKACSFGLNYGTSPKKFCENMAKVTGLPFEYYQEIVENYYDLYYSVFGTKCLKFGKEKNAAGFYYRKGGLKQDLQENMMDIAKGVHSISLNYGIEIAREELDVPVITITFPSGRKIFMRNPKVGFWSYENYATNDENDNDELLVNFTKDSEGNVITSKTIMKKTEDAEEVTFDIDEELPAEVIMEAKELGYRQNVRSGNTSLIPGTIINYIVQGISADLIHLSVQRLHRNDYTANIVVHDEIITNITSEDDIAKINSLMTTEPKWLPGIPLSVDGYCSPYFTKVNPKMTIIECIAEVNKVYEGIDLNNKLIEANEAFERGDELLMPDKEFDELVQKCNKVNKIETILPTLASGDVKFKHPFLSISKVKEGDDSGKLERFKASAAMQEFTRSPKYDGVAIEIRYKDGKYVQGVTHGRGGNGKDRTERIAMIQDIPMQLNEPLSCEIRGEVVAPKGDRSRNIASGAVVGNKSSVISSCHFKPFEAFGEEFQKIDTHYNKMTKLQELGFNPVEVEVVTELVADKKDYAFDTDGVIFRINDNHDYILRGNTRECHKGSLAFKFYDDLYEAKVKSVEFNVSANGKVVPKVITEVTVIDGKNWELFTANNLDWLQKSDIRIGDTISFSIANMIIPKIHGAVIEVRDGSEVAIVIPTECPACHTPLSNDTCINEECKAKLPKRIAKFCKVTKIKGMGEKTAIKVVESLNLKSVADFYTIHSLNLGSVIGNLKASKICKQLAEVKNNASWKEKIVAMGIPSLGSAAIENISLDEIINGKVNGESKVAENVNKYLATGDNYKNLLVILESSALQKVS